MFPDGAWQAAAAQTVPAIIATGQAIAAQARYNDLRNKIDNFQRQEIINPYANASNPYRNLAVATKAAEMKAEQTDMALANTLDSLRQTGAGGATALAQAALRSKQGIAANIEQQEIQNQRLEAKGEQMLQKQQALGKAYMFEARETRELQELNRLQAMSDEARLQRATSMEAIGESLGSAADTLASKYTPGLTIEEQMAADKGKSISLTPKSGINTSSNQPNANLTLQKASFDPLADFEGTETFTSRTPSRGMQRVPVNTQRGLQGIGTPYYGVPMSSAATFLMDPGVNLTPINQFMPIQNTSNPFNMPQGGNMIGETYIDPITGQRLTM